MPKESLKLISWNVNGLRAVLKKEALQPVIDKKPDILCLQETKMCVDTVPELELMHFPYRYFNYAAKKGYSGTAILSRVEPLRVFNGFLKPKFDHTEEGRVITAEFPKFFLVNVYTPNSKSGLERLPYRENEWDVDFLAHIKDLEKKKPVVVCGDLNVAHEEIDIARPKTNTRSAGFTDEERKSFSKLLDSGFIDTFRHLHPNAKDRYSWWSLRAGSRAKNVGWRIDYFLTSKDLSDSIKSADIFDDLYGSDHAPVVVELSV